MKKIFEFKEKKSVIASIIFTVLFCALGILTLIYREELLETVAHGNIKKYYAVLAAFGLIVFASIVLAWVKNSHFRGKLTNPFVTLSAAAVGSLWIVERFSQNSMLSMRPIAIAVNLVLIGILFFALMAVINRSAAAGIIGSSILYTVSLVNYFTLKFRGTVMLPADVLYSGKTALDVASSYDFSPDSRMLLTTAAFLLLLLFLYKTNHKCRLRGRLASAVLAAALILCSTQTTFDREVIAKLGVQPNLWDPTGMGKEIGFWQNMMSSIYYLKADKPEGYSHEAAQAILADAPRIPSDREAIAPNVIVIMAEAMADLTNVGPLELSEDPLANLHRLAKDAGAKTGFCAVPVYGGGTSCSEFEFLTGCSMRFLGTAIAPYQQYIHSETENFLTEMDEAYKNFAIHSYGAENWGRATAYPLLGFDRFVSYEDAEFEDATYSRDWISDAKMMEVVAEMSASADPSVVFGITMECHGGYQTEGFESTVRIENMSQVYEDAEQYLTCLKSSDAAIGALIDSCRNSDEPTIVLVFGDHLPTLSDSFYGELKELAGEVDAAHEQLRMYETPYLFWSNYGADFSEVPDLLSTNFLYPYLMRGAGMELDGFASCLYNLSQEFPVVSLYGVVDAAGTVCSYAPDQPCYEAIHEYQIIQYHRLKNQ